MTHLAFIKSHFTVLAETANGIFFDACGELCAEINGTSVLCSSVEEFFDLAEFFGDETFQI